MACMEDYPVFVKGTDFSYKILINTIKDDQKKSIAKRLYVLGITVIPHSSRYILTTSRMSVGLHVLARCIMGGGLQFVYLAVFSIKIPLHEVRCLEAIQSPSITI